MACVTSQVQSFGPPVPISIHQLAPIVHGDHFWFSWVAIKPNTIIFVRAVRESPLPSIHEQAIDGHRPTSHLFYTAGFTTCYNASRNILLRYKINAEYYMPEISRFHGVIIRIFYETGRHRLPHFHAVFGDHMASFTIDPPALLAGTMPRKQLHLILAWTELHQEELIED